VVVILDLDAALVNVSSTRRRSPPRPTREPSDSTPYFCFADATGETLSAKLRAGNATANNASDHIEFPDAGLAQLPLAITQGHHAGDDPQLATRQVIARAENATPRSSVVRSNAQITGAIYATFERGARAAFARAEWRSGRACPPARYEMTQYLVS
jgi:hypothetical protein